MKKIMSILIVFFMIMSAAPVLALTAQNSTNQEMDSIPHWMEQYRPKGMPTSTITMLGDKKLKGTTSEDSTFRIDWVTIDNHEDDPNEVIPWINWNTNIDSDDFCLFLGVPDWVHGWYNDRNQEWGTVIILWVYDYTLFPIFWKPVSYLCFKPSNNLYDWPFDITSSNGMNFKAKNEYGDEGKLKFGEDGYYMFTIAMYARDINTLNGFNEEKEHCIWESESFKVGEPESVVKEHAKDNARLNLVSLKFIDLFKNNDINSRFKFIHNIFYRILNKN